MDVLEECPENEVIADNMARAYAIINSDKYDKIVCSVSGGSDSDVMLDICRRVDKNNRVEYVWFDTGLEYQATKDHLKFLENKYDIEIKSYKALKPIPICCKKYGQPFLSKYVSEMMQRLQSHKFKWEDKTFEELYKEYPKCKVALQWWCNTNKSLWFNIERNKYLKQFIIKNPPTFLISNKCCQYAKKDVVHKLIKDNHYDLEINGVRKAEGGIRDAIYKNCFSENDEHDVYRPLFWYKNSDKEEYERRFNITHSECYSKYGLKRTGCACCPYGRDFEFELEVAKEYEPKLHKAISNIFGDSYEYTRKYREFVEKMKSE